MSTVSSRNTSSCSVSGRSASSRTGPSSGCAPSRHTPPGIATRGTSYSRVFELRLRRLLDLCVTLPTFVLELDRLDEHRIGVRIQVGLRGELADPRAIHLVRDDLLSGLVEHVDREVATEVLERHFLLALLGRSLGVAEIPHLVRPRLELRIVRDAAFHRDRLVFRAPRRLVTRARVAAFAVL